MGFRFRRSIKIVPGIRLNLSRAGPSVSLGVRGLHHAIGLRGTRTTLSIPGSGVSWSTYRAYSSAPQSQPGRRLTAVADPSVAFPEAKKNEPSATVFESAAIEELVAQSTSELAPILDGAQKQWGWSPIVLALALSAFALAALYHSQPATIGALVFGIIAWPAMAILDRKGRTITLEYNLNDDLERNFHRLVSAFNGLAACQRVWRVPSEMHQSDWKRNAGAAYTDKRDKISATLGLPHLIKSNLTFPALLLGEETIYFAPDAILIVARNRVAALRYDEIEVSARSIRFIESEGVPLDAQVIGETWQFVNKKGGPDRRFANNRRLPICSYGEMDLKSTKGLNERVQCSLTEAAVTFASSFLAMRQSETSSLPEVSPMMDPPKTGSIFNQYSPLETLLASIDEPNPIYLCARCRSKDFAWTESHVLGHHRFFVCNECGTKLRQVGEKYKLDHVADMSCDLWEKYGGQTLYSREWANIANGGLSDAEFASHVVKLMHREVPSETRG
jgi:hypothetical protein